MSVNHNAEGGVSGRGRRGRKMVREANQEMRAINFADYPELARCFVAMTQRARNTVESLLFRPRN